MNKLKKISILAIAGIAALSTTVFAGKMGKVYNTSQGLVLRKEASKTSEAITTVPNDKEFAIIEIAQGDWYKVSVDGQEGYLFAEYVKLIDETPSEETTEEEQNENNEQLETIASNATKSETKIYMLPLITSSKIGIIPENTELEIVKNLNNWAYVSYEGVSGWIRTYNYNVEKQEQPEEIVLGEEEEVTAPEPEETVEDSKPEENTNLSFTKGYIKEESVNVRKEPSTSSEVITNLILNTGVTIIAQTDEWYKITYGDYIGYIYKPLISDTPTVTNRGNEIRQPETTPEVEENTQTEDTEVEKEEVKEEVVETPSVSSNGDKIVSFAKQYLGYRYVYGGTTPGSGFDCSGFIYYVFNSCGYSISRSLSAQASKGTAVSKSELQPGDIVFFNNTSNGSLGHVGIYIGNGNMIHAANSNRGVVTDTINSGYYNTYYYSARRVAY